MLKKSFAQCASYKLTLCPAELPTAVSVVLCRMNTSTEFFGFSMKKVNVVSIMGMPKPFLVGLIPLTAVNMTNASE